MSFDAERLFALLPAVLRSRDEILRQRLSPADEAGPLKALMSVLAQQAQALEQNLDQLYDDLFIETCAPWVVPYIADLVGARRAFAFPGAKLSERAFVANTIAYRRRKGSAAGLEQMARDVTDWPARVVEYFQLLSTSQYLNHVRPDSLGTATLRNPEPLRELGTAFETTSRSVDVRRIAQRRGRYNIANVGIHLFRLASFSVTDAPAYRVDGERWLFDALGRSRPLFSKPEPETSITSLASSANVPRPLARLRVQRQAVDYYGPARSFWVSVDDVQIELDQISICDLSDVGVSWAHLPGSKVAIDPELGRLALPSSLQNRSVRVGYYYGFSAPMGGGEYPRALGFSQEAPTLVVPRDQPTLQAALDQLHTDGVVELRSSDYLVEAPNVVAGTPGGTGAKLELRAADGRRPLLVLAAGQTLSVIGGAESEVTLNGLLIAGGCVHVPASTADGVPNQLRTLRLRHCTLVPGSLPALAGQPAQAPAARLVVEQPGLRIELEHCIIGPIQALADTTLCIRDSIVDAGAESELAVAAPTSDGFGPALHVEDSTLIGRVRVARVLLASNSIFLAAGTSTSAPLLAERLQEGCVRFSFVPPGSRLPRPYRCQPTAEATAARVRPIFSSLAYGDAAYGQLESRCAAEIREGADDGAELGAFHDQQVPQRLNALRACLDEYLRFNLEAGAFLAT